MSLSKQEFSSHIKQFQFRELFNNLGWNNDSNKLQISSDENIYTLQVVAEKSGFKILVCPSGPNGLIPDYHFRKKLETKVTKIFQEHLIIYYDSKQQEQIWQLVIRQTSRPTKVTEIRYHLSQDPELLYQRASGLFFKMDEEENITIVDVTQRVAANFQQNAEKVTKKFYDNFKKEHTSFLSFIKRIEKKVDKDWYASLMLNRLMFCYFIQKKGFLDGNRNYLRDKLNACKQKKGKNKFYSFYRDFLLVLFHEGLNEAFQKETVKIELGKIPYLNGGLFDEHELEKIYKDIEIDDRAFERVFDFFDQYEWHLDTRISATGKDINPDIIGYIFEKYINDRAQMGAYYTKEDITEYISKNCVLPWLFDETKRRHSIAFAPDGEIWKSVKENGDNYIYDDVKYGIDPENIWGDLSDKITAGIDPGQPNLIEKRKTWNIKAPPEIALPTETYREVIDRRQRFIEIKTNIENGEIIQINDFITYNLNIRQFAQDVIENTNDSDFLWHFYGAINSISILDPTCGSGAFLFAAMNILEPLYEACIMRMRAFVEEEDRLNELKKGSFSNRFKIFRQVLAETQNEYHPNLQYFIFKSIILQNLYGVDIMKEAVEIAKLRLFLKLVATVDADYKKPNLGLEPLPDIDFNIRAGNTLVGFATEEDIKNAFGGILDFDNDAEKIKEKCDIVANVFNRYKERQLGKSADHNDFKSAKAKLNKRLKELNHELNILLHKQAIGLKYDSWLESHQPFHWFAEFYEIIHGKSGFDVIIGNPPYVVYSALNFEYKLKDYQTLSCANLYAYCCERSFRIMKDEGRFGMIIPNSSISADKLSPLQKFFTKDKTSWISNYSWRPSKLFEGADMLLAIIISTRSEPKIVYSSMYQKWYVQYREALFENIKYYDSTNVLIEGSIPKIPSNKYYSILSKILNRSGKRTLGDSFLNSFTNYKFYYFRAVQYWVKILDTEPIYLDNGKQTVTGEMKPVNVENEDLMYILISILSSSIYFIHYITWASCQVINSRDFMFPFDKENLDKDLAKQLVKLGIKLQKDYRDNSKIIKRTYAKKGRSFTMEKQHFYIKKSKPILDEIDKLLAKHYCFTQEELDFIINYDIKYRMGKGLDNGEEE